MIRWQHKNIMGKSKIDLEEYPQYHADTKGRFL